MSFARLGTYTHGCFCLNLVVGEPRLRLGRWILRWRGLGQSFRARRSVAHQPGWCGRYPGSPHEVPADRRCRTDQGPRHRRGQTAALLLGSNLPTGPCSSGRTDRAMALPGQTRGVRTNVGRTTAGSGLPGSMSEELAWAGGFFDGEGSTYLEKHRTHQGYLVPRLYVPQSAEIGIAPELTRLKSALGGLGAISGLRPGKGTWKPYRRWRVSAVLDVQVGLHLLWPFIGRVKRTQAQRVLQVMHSQPDPPRGNPTSA